MTIFPAMWNALESAPHGLDGGLIGTFAVPLAHGSRRCHGAFFHHARQLERQVLFQINRGLIAGCCHIAPQRSGGFLSYCRTDHSTHP